MKTKRIKSKAGPTKSKAKGINIDLAIQPKTNGSHSKAGHHSKNGHAGNGHAKNGHLKNGHVKPTHPLKPESYVLQPVVEAVLTESDLYQLLVKVRNGNFSVRLPAGQIGMKHSICQVMNEIIDLNERMAIE